MKEEERERQGERSGYQKVEIAVVTVLIHLLILLFIGYRLETPAPASVEKPILLEFAPPDKKPVYKIKKMEEKKGRSLVDRKPIVPSPKQKKKVSKKKASRKPSKKTPPLKSPPKGEVSTLEADKEELKKTLPSVSFPELQANPRLKRAVPKIEEKAHTFAEVRTPRKKIIQKKVPLRHRVVKSPPLPSTARPPTFFEDLKSLQKEVKAHQTKKKKVKLIKKIVRLVPGDSKLIQLASLEPTKAVPKSIQKIKKKKVENKLPDFKTLTPVPKVKAAPVSKVKKVPLKKKVSKPSPTVKLPVSSKENSLKIKEASVLKSQKALPKKKISKPPLIAKLPDPPKEVSLQPSKSKAQISSSHAKIKNKIKKTGETVSSKKKIQKTTSSSIHKGNRGRRSPRSIMYRQPSYGSPSLSDAVSSAMSNYRPTAGMVQGILSRANRKDFATFEGLELSTYAWDFAPWLQKMIRRIKDKWYQQIQWHRDELRSYRKNTSVVIRFTIKKGSVRAAPIVKLQDGPIPVFFIVANDGLKATQFPELPPEFPDSKLDITIQYRYLLSGPH